MEHTTERDVYEPQSKPSSRRIAFCPTCGRPFTRGTGFFQSSCLERMPGGGAPKEDNPDCPEYCSERCVPAIPA